MVSVLDYSIADSWLLSRRLYPLAFLTVATSSPYLPYLVLSCKLCYPSKTPPSFVHSLTRVGPHGIR